MIISSRYLIGDIIVEAAGIFFVMHVPLIGTMPINGYVTAVDRGNQIEWLDRFHSYDCILCYQWVIQNYVIFLSKYSNQLLYYT